MRLPHLVAQAIVTFAVAALIVPLVVVLVPAARDSQMGLVVVGGVLAGVFGLLRVLWPRPRT